jgi:glutamyl-tRNA reductase
VPRDAEPSIGNLDGLYLFDIDDLEKVVTANLKERASEARGAERIVAAEVSQFRKWQRAQRAVPTIRSLRHHFRTIARTEVDKAIAQLSDDTTAEQHEEAIRRLGNIIVNKLLHVPMTALKSGDEEEMELLVSATQRLFDLPDDDHDDGDGPARGASRAEVAADLSAGSSAAKVRAGKARETDSP